MQGHKYSHICNLWGMFLPMGMICTITDAISIPVGAIYLHARMFCALVHTSSIPMGAINFYINNVLTLTDTTFIPMFVMFVHARMFCTLSHSLLFPWVQCQNLKPVLNQCSKTGFVTADYFITLYTRSYVFYSHRCNKFLDARMFFTLADTTFISIAVMYLHARMLCTLAHVFYSHGCNKFLHARIFSTLAGTIATIFSLISEVWPLANWAVVTNNLTVIIKAVLIEGFLYREKPTSPTVFIIEPWNNFTLTKIKFNTYFSAYKNIQKF